MSINSNEGNDFCNRYNEVLKSDKKKMIAAAAACTIVMGAGFGGYLYYGAYYASGWHTHDGSTYYIVKETGEKALGYQITPAIFLTTRATLWLTAGISIVGTLTMSRTVLFSVEK